MISYLGIGFSSQAIANYDIPGSGPRSAPQQNNSFIFNRFRTLCTKHAGARGIVSQGVLSALCAPFSPLSGARSGASNECGIPSDGTPVEFGEKYAPRTSRKAGRTW